MQSRVNFADRATNRYVSWADRVFNPWLSPTRGVGCSRGETAGLVHDARVGDERAALTWNANAEAFAFGNEGRRQRVFAGPWCHALSADVGDIERTRFWSLVRKTPALDWMVLTGRSLDIPAALPSDWGRGYDNVWIGAKVSGPESANVELQKLKRIPARLRFMLATPLLDDLGDLDLSGLGWVIVGTERGAPAQLQDWVVSVKLQAMCYGVPTWTEENFASLASCRSGPSEMQGHPRTALQDS